MSDSHDEEIDDALLKLLKRNKDEGFFGITELHFSAGKLMRVKQQEVLLPKDLLRLAA